MADSGIGGEETVTTLNGLFKEVYGDDVKHLIPEGLKVQGMIPFVPKQKELGNKYHQPVVLAYPSGFTHAAAQSGAFTLLGASASTLKDAQIDGSQILLREYMDYEAAAKAAKGRNAFVDATSLMFELMQKAIRKRLEVELLYGGQDLGVVASVSSNTITITDATWAPGIWAGSEGTSLDIFDTTGVTQRGGGTGHQTITSVDLINKTVTCSGGLQSGVVAGDRLFFQGANGAEMSGIYQILTNTGTLFNINAGTYNLWQSTQYAVGGVALTFNAVKAAVARAVGKGLEGDCTLLVNPLTWDNLLSDLATLRRFVEKQGKGTQYEIGSKEISFYAQNGSIEIVPSIYVKAGHAFGLQADTWKRIGATDITFQTPGYGGQIFTQLQSNAGFDVRAYTHQAVFSEMPARNFIITGIVNA